MTKRDPGEVYRALVAAGADPAAATTLTAIAGGESGWNDSALGDTSLENSTWGPSFGAFQIRTLKADTGTGSDRDIAWLSQSLANQAKAAEDISAGGSNFSPWTVYRTGRWKDFLAQVRAAVGGSSSSTTTTVGDSAPIPKLPTFGPGWLPWNIPSDIGNAAIDQANQTLSGSRDLLVKVLFSVVAVGLVGAGLVKLSGSRVKRVTGRVDAAGAAVAKAAAK